MTHILLHSISLYSYNAFYTQMSQVCYVRLKILYAAQLFIKSSLYIKISETFVFRPCLTIAYVKRICNTLLSTDTLKLI